MKKKVSTITFHESHNFGALLQTYALQKKIEEMGFDVEIIDYHSLRKEEHYSNKYDKKQSLAANINKWLSWKFRKKRQKFADIFRDEYLKLSTRRFTSGVELEQYANKRDFLICGSDQIWNYNSTRADPVYFLDFVNDPEKKIAYAPSFGISEIPASMLGFYQNNLSNFGKISVREATGAEMVYSIVGKKVPVVLDPCLLIKRDAWNEFSKPIDYNKPYIFVYYIKYSSDVVKYAKKLEKQTGYQVVISAHTIRDLKDRFENVDMSVPQFVGAIQNAEYVLTNSYHATLFSIIFHKRFKVFLDCRKNNTNSRLMGLLEKFELQQCADVREMEFVEWDYKKVKNIWEREMKDSEAFLKNALEYHTVV